jgi:hypothetical protein
VTSEGEFRGTGGGCGILPSDGVGGKDQSGSGFDGGMEYIRKKRSKSKIQIKIRKRIKRRIKSRSRSRTILRRS